MTDSSDLDVFIDYDKANHFSPIELVGIKQLLERRLGISVDLTTGSCLAPPLRARIEASAEQVFLMPRLVGPALRLMGG